MRRRNIFAGQGAVIDTGADMNPITRARRFQFVELGETGADKAGGSRASAHVLFRNALREAAELRRFAVPVSARARSEPSDPIVRDPNESRLIGPDARRSEDVLLTRFDAAALVPVLQGRQYLLVHVERASDILQVLELKREFPALKLVLVGATEGWTVADQIAAADVPVIASAVNDLPASFEMIAATQSNVGRMRAAGVKVSIGMIDDNDTRYLFNQRQYAGNLVALGKVPGAAGVSWGEALAMITSRSAEAIGMGGEIGSLAAGRRGDVVIWSGDPLEGSSAAEMVWIDGVRQPLETRQTKLRDRYRDLRAQRIARGVPAVSPLALLGLAAFSFVATHFIMSHPLRAGLVARLGERGFLLAYTVVAFATLGWTIWAFGRVPAEAPLVGRGRCGVVGRYPADVAGVDPVHRLAAQQSVLPECRQANAHADAARGVRDHPPSDDVGLRAVGAGPCDRRRDAGRTDPCCGDRLPRPRRGGDAGLQEGAADGRRVGRMASTYGVSSRSRGVSPIRGCSRWLAGPSCSSPRPGRIKPAGFWRWFG